MIAKNVTSVTWRKTNLHDCKGSKTLLALPSGKTNLEKTVQGSEDLNWWEEDRWRAVAKLFLKSDLRIESLHNGGILLTFGRLRKAASEACTAMWYWCTIIPFFLGPKGIWAAWFTLLIAGPSECLQLYTKQSCFHGRETQRSSACIVVLYSVYTLVSCVFLLV
jgi:hypothetical protein